MFTLRSVIAAAALVAVACLPGVARAQSNEPLRVIRVAPAGEAGPTDAIAVTFDRPVAGSLDQTIDPATILRVDPAVPGKLEWRDPVTIRLVPTAPLVAGTRYTVTVANSFRAMDGGRLAQPYQFVFRALGPIVLTGAPAGADDTRRAMHVVPNQRFELVYSAPVDLARLSATAYLEFSTACAGGQRVIPLRASSQRALRSDDPGRYRYAGFNRIRTVDTLRRVVQLVPARTLPYACSGDLVTPTELAADLPKGYTRYGFQTYGELRVSALTCSYGRDICPTGPLTLEFSNPVRGAEVLRRIRLYPETRFAIGDTAELSTRWTLDARLVPRMSYAVVIDTALRDAFGQPLRGNPAVGYRTTGYAPSINYAYGRRLVERAGVRTLPVEHVNVDTLVATVAAIPDSLEPRLLGRPWGNAETWDKVLATGTRRLIPVKAAIDQPSVTGLVLPTPAVGDSRTLLAVRVSGRAGGRDVVSDQPVAIIQVTDLGVHAKVGKAEGIVWVTGVNDGRAKEGATVTLYDGQGKRLTSARTDAQGIARLSGWNAAVDQDEGDEEDFGGFEGAVKVSLGEDRAMVPINAYDPDLSPWRFNVSSAYGDGRFPLAGAVFTERGIYRPGERVYAKSILRHGALGALKAPAGDSVKWTFQDRDGAPMRDTVLRLNQFGTADVAIELPASAALGTYVVQVRSMMQGEWRDVAQATYRVAEYRPPEFLVNVSAPSAPRFPGDTLMAAVQARYLFGAPMGRAAMTWMAQQTSMYSWDLDIPNTEGWFVGESGWWWEDDDVATQVFASGVDTLDAKGERRVAVRLPEPAKGRAARVTVQTTVTDVNRQVVGSSVSAVVHPAAFYIAAKPAGARYFWQAGSPQSVSVLAVRPDGQRVEGVTVAGTVVRREWHRVHRVRDGVPQVVGEWVSDTVARCTLTTASAPVSCAFTPAAGGIYVVSFTAQDARGRAATTSFQRWTVGSDWVPWSDETQFKMDVIPDRTRYAVGDTATVMFASPFVDAEAWITVEREGIIDTRRLRLTSGTTTLKFPITEAFAPNAFISIVVARGRSAKPGPLDDPGRPTIRVGYAEVRVTPEVKRLTVALRPDKAEYRPGDSALVNIQVRDAQNRGPRTEVTLWAVDEGVLALTGYKTPDPIDLIYSARGLGMRLASNMTAVVPQVAEGEKGQREAGGGGGAEGADVLRSRFQTTAFFLGSVVTDAQGNAQAVAKLPDNLTTFRVMAVAVTAGDRYGSGQSEMLVTRPLLARAALPRFVRPADQFTAGAVINRRDGAATTPRVTAAATGVTLRGPAERQVTLSPSRGAEVRFPFDALRGDSASFRFDVRDGGDADAVRVAIPVRPDHHVQAHVASGILRDTATALLRLPANIDPARSTLSLSLGASPLATIRGMSEHLRVYPYYCSEQVISAAVPLIALLRARQEGAPIQTRDPRPDVLRAVEMLTRRQREDGAIGYWSSRDWSSPWLSAYAGLVLLDARDAGVPVDTLVLGRLAGYLTGAMRGDSSVFFTAVGEWYRSRQILLRDQVAAVDFLSRMKRPAVPAENELFRNAAMLSVEDRARLAEILARRGQAPLATALMASVWPRVRVEGRTAVIPDSLTPRFYFESPIRPLALILAATLVVQPDHPLVGPLVESLVQQGRAAQATWVWNTQDYASAIAVLARYERLRRAQGTRTVTVRTGERGRVLLSTSTDARSGPDSLIPLAGLLRREDRAQVLRLVLDGGAGDAPIYYFLTVNEIPSTQPVSVQEEGIRVERWYEKVVGGGPVTSVPEGELVRVRLRVTVDATRNFVVVDDALPAGLEAVDLSLRTESAVAGPGVNVDESGEESERRRWGYGYWDAGWWSPFDHREMRDDRVVYSATVLWPGAHNVTYLARATTPGTFIKPPAHAEEMYNPAVRGRSDGGTFVVTPRTR